MQRTVNVVLNLIGLVGAVSFVLLISAGLTYIGPKTEAVAAESVPVGGLFNPYSVLDTSHIDDQRGRVPTGWGTGILLPEGYSLDTTPMVTVQDVWVVVPEESPDGGYVLSPDQWVDDSPLYDDGWLLRVDDTHHTVTWSDQYLG